MTVHHQHASRHSPASHLSGRGSSAGSGMLACTDHNNIRSSIPERRETATPRQASSHDQALVRDVTSRRPTRPAGRSDPTPSRPIRASDTAPADAPADVIGRTPQPRRAGPAPGVQEREACARAREAGRRLARGCVHRSVDRQTQYSVPET